MYKINLLNSNRLEKDYATKVRSCVNNKWVLIGSKTIETKESQSGKLLLTTQTKEKQNGNLEVTHANK